jgi:hypothetical protein
MHLLRQTDLALYAVQPLPFTMSQIFSSENTGGGGSVRRIPKTTLGDDLADGSGSGCRHAVNAALYVSAAEGFNLPVTLNSRLPFTVVHSDIIGKFFPLLGCSQPASGQLLR